MTLFTLFLQLADIPEDAIRLFGIKLINSTDLLELVIRFFFNLTMIIVIVRYLYYAATRRKDYLFTYMLISAVVFLLCFSLENAAIEMGVALGLFAIFGIIRYRTNPIPIKEMTYLFVVIGLSVINSFPNKKISYAELLFINIAVLAIVYGLERIWLLKHETQKTVIYEKIDLIKPAKYQELLADLEDRTGLSIRRIEVGRIDFLRDTARLRIYYYESENEINQSNLEDEEALYDNDNE